MTPSVRKALYSFFGTVALIVNMAMCNSQVLINQNSSGDHQGGFYSFWKDSGDATMTLFDEGRFTAEFTSATNNWIGGLGWNPSGYRVIDYSGNFSATATSNAYLTAHGWIQNPLVEFFIIDRWGTYNPSNNPTIQALGTLTSDGAVYDLYLEHRNPGSGIVLSEVERRTYYSIRRDKKPLGQVSGTITTANHFNAWARAGLPIGELDFMTFGVYSYQGSGSADLTVRQGPSNCGSSEATPVCCSISADPDQDGFGVQFGGEVCMVTEHTIGWHPANPNEILAAINLGGFWEAYPIDGVWYEANTFVSGGSVATTQSPIIGSDSPIYKSALEGDYTIDIPVNGTQTLSIELGAVEYELNNPNIRMQSIEVEGQTYLADTDIFAEVGRATLWRPEPILVDVSDGMLNITIRSNTSKPATLSSVLVRKMEEPITAENPNAAGSVGYWFSLLILGSCLWRKRIARTISNS